MSVGYFGWQGLAGVTNSETNTICSFQVYGIPRGQEEGVTETAISAQCIHDSG